MVKLEEVLKKQNVQPEQKKILLLIPFPLTKQNYDRIGIPFLSKNFTVVVFQCSNWIGRGSAPMNLVEEKWEKYEIIKSETQFEDLLKQYKPNYAIDFLGLGPFSPKIGRSLKRQSTQLVIQKLGSLPYNRELYLRFKHKLTSRTNFNHRKNASSITKSGINSVKNSGQVSNSALTRAKLKIYQKLLPFILRLNIPYIALLAGNKSNSIFTRMAKETIWASSNDYHTFQKTTRIHSNVKSRDYILFLDDCVTDALDFHTLKISPPVSSEVYFLQLNKFFKSLEEEYSLPVLIAGHPNKIKDKNYSQNFNDREVIYGKTSEMVLHSCSVLLHASTSVSYAILSRKLITSLTTKELDLSFMGKSVRSISKAVGSNLVFIDQNYVHECLTTEINVKKYMSYEFDFLRNRNSKENYPWEAFTEYVLKRGQ